MLDRRIRALSPAPGAVAGWRSGAVKIRAAIPLDGISRAAPGVVVAVGAPGIDVACGTDARAGVLRLTLLQPAAGRAMPAHAFAVGRGILPGGRFDPGV